MGLVVSVLFYALVIGGGGGGGLTIVLSGKGVRERALHRHLECFSAVGELVKLARFISKKVSSYVAHLDERVVVRKEFVSSVCLLEVVTFSRPGSTKENTAPRNRLLIFGGR